MQAYWQEFIIFAVANILSLISPGPDFLMVVQTSLRYSRRSALLVALGISCGEMIHVSYSIIGISWIIVNNAWLFTILKYLGASYLFYIGIHALRAKPQLTGPNLPDCPQPSRLSDLAPWHAFRRGLLTNALNAKAAFFTISFFTVLVSPTTPLAIQAGYAAFIFISTFVWFALVSLVLTHSRVQARFLNVKHWIERCCGGLLVTLGIKLALSDM